MSNCPLISIHSVVKIFPVNRRMWHHLFLTISHLRPEPDLFITRVWRHQYAQHWDSCRTFQHGDLNFDVFSSPPLVSPVHRRYPALIMCRSCKCGIGLFEATKGKEHAVYFSYKFLLFGLTWCREKNVWVQLCVEVTGCKACWETYYSSLLSFFFFFYKSNICILNFKPVSWTENWICYTRQLHRLWEIFDCLLFA